MRLISAIDCIYVCLFSLEADPNYKPVFSAGESSKSPLKTSTAIVKKFDSAHKKQFSRYMCPLTHTDVMVNSMINTILRDV